MRIAFDPNKDALNIDNHGLTLKMAEQLEWDAMLVKQDTRKQYGEKRMVGFAPIGDRLHCVVFVDRGDERRIISLRRANAREVKHYVDEA